MSIYVSVLIIQLLLKGVALTEQFDDKYTDAPLKVRPGQWNSVTFTVEQPTAELPHGRVRLYVNGVLFEQASNLVTLSKICQVLIKLNLNQRGTKTVWSSNLQVRNLMFKIVL